jgi:peptidoglycan hydrolase-like protein with peptidoglycan-binding domain
MMKKGDRNPEVSELQRSLCEMGYEIEIDGIFGPITEWAVLNVQAMFGYVVDGIVGTETKRLIEAQHKLGFNLRRRDAQRWALKAAGLLKKEATPASTVS